MSDKDYALAVQEKIIHFKITIEDNYYKLAKLAKTFLAEQLYLDLGYNDPEHWAKEVLGYGVRKLQYLIGIEAKFEACGVSDNDRQQIEWTKARQVVRVLTSDNATEWINKARSLTVKELQDEVAGEKVARNIQDYKPIGYLYIPYYNEDQKLTMLEAMELAAKMTASDRKEVQIMAICQEFMGTYASYGEAIDDPMKRAIYERDNWTCRFPDCGKRDNLEIHEIVFRSHGGKMSEDNSILLCNSHHREVTDSKIKIEKIGNNQYRFLRNKC